MAEAWLEPWRKNDQGELVVYVRNNGCSGKPADPSRLLPGRRWGSPHLGDGKLVYEYRTLADEICSFLAERARGRRLGRSRIDRHIAFWMSNAAESCVEHDDEISAEAAFDDDKMRALVLTQAAARPSDIFDPSSLLHAHGTGICDGDGTDLEFQIAAEALDLPRWAHRDIYDEGGVGGGYAQAAVVLEPGRSFQELSDWLLRRASKDRRTGGQSAGGDEH